ncbi:hypothetical protein GCM10007874_39380 [Labrys miyagiensis]|uniref:Uncharacterized protein n=1 Tax=Labrys miyagiensis TaxID=346912 RepID=A0ABQ6CKP9_9HYPH|nr:hypothetical protein [Labrys miyagiensis]GLS20921.1 hypothetical protein GCM10007874_39380 [Labrys miyagiensis]
MNSAQNNSPAESIIAAAVSSVEEISDKPKDYISVTASPDLTLATITIFGQDKSLASIDFDADQLDILISRIVAVRDALSGRR